MTTFPAAADRDLPEHAEVAVVVAAPVDSVFAYVDDHRRLTSHMAESSWMMGGGEMRAEVDGRDFRAVGSHLRLCGRAFGIPLLVEEAVTERIPPFRKVWRTTAPPRLLVIGAYQMGFEISAEAAGSRLRVFIDYERPGGALRWLARAIGAYYARWCVRRMADDTARHFAALRATGSFPAPMRRMP